MVLYEEKILFTNLWENMKKIKKVCPECFKMNFKTDVIHAEVYCRNCGLVIIAPPQCGVVFPGYKVISSKRD